MTDNRARIMNSALDVLGREPGATMAEIAAAAGVVRRTLYAHFPSRGDLVHALTEHAVHDILGAVEQATGEHQAADAAWSAFVARLWPLVVRYRILVRIRRGPDGEGVHAALEPVDTALARLVARGQRDGVFGSHLAAPALSQAAWSVLFIVVDGSTSFEAENCRAAIIATLLVLGVGDSRATILADAMTGSDDGEPA